MAAVSNIKIFRPVRTALMLLAVGIGSLLGIAIIKDLYNNSYMISESGIDGHSLTRTERSNNLLFDYTGMTFLVEALYKGPHEILNEKTRAFFEQHRDDIVFTIVSRYSDGSEETIDVYLKELMWPSQLPTYQKYGYLSNIGYRFYFNQGSPAGEVVRIFIPNNEVLLKLLDDYKGFRIDFFGGFPRNKLISMMVQVLLFCDSLIIYSANLSLPIWRPEYIPINRVLAAIAIFSFTMLLALIVITLRRRYVNA